MIASLRRIIGIKWPNVISNEELRERTGQVKLSEEGIPRAIKWDESRIARAVDEWMPMGIFCIKVYVTKSTYPMDQVNFNNS